MLYLISTPIGNLSDLSHRSVEVLNASDYLLVEDTRHSKILLQKYTIQKKLIPFHLFSEKKEEERVIEDLKAGKTIGLLSDAGTPLINDPGFSLVQRCIEEGIAISALPGPCALIVALTLSGMKTDRFQFLGFLPRAEKECRQTLQECLYYRYTSIVYESPHRLLETLTLLEEMDAYRHLAVARELTKHYEEVLRGPAPTLISNFKKNPVKGECVLLISGRTEERSLPTLEELETLQKQWNLSRREIVRLVADLEGLPRNALYKLALDLDERQS